MADRGKPGLRLSPVAQRDLDGIFDYTVQKWGVQQAVHYTHLLAGACESFARRPELAQDASHVRTGYRRGAVGRHVIWFRVEADGIVVVRVLHQRMDAPRHL